MGNLLRLALCISAVSFVISCQKSSSPPSSEEASASAGAGIAIPPEYQGRGMGGVQSSTSTTSKPTSGITNNPATDKGVGPIQSIKLGPIDEALAKKGQQLFEANCTACHKLDKKYIGPALGDVANRATPEFIMNMMLDTPDMLKEDPIAKSLLEQYGATMAVNINKDQARAILEYLREVAKMQKK